MIKVWCDRVRLTCNGAYLSPSSTAPSLYALWTQLDFQTLVNGSLLKLAREDPSTKGPLIDEVFLCEVAHLAKLKEASVTTDLCFPWQLVGLMYVFS